MVAKLVQRSPHRIEQGIVHQERLVQGKAVQLLWQGKHHMVVGTRQQIRFTLLYPLLPLVALALGTVPVATTIVADVQAATVGTRIHMTAQCRCAAQL